MPPLAERWLGRLTALLAALAVTAGAAILLLIVASVVLRYVEGQPLRFTEEAVGLLVSAMLFLVLPRVSLERRHVAVRLVVDRLGGRPRRLADAIGQTVMVAFCGWWAIAAWPWFLFTYERDLKSVVARLPLTPWVALVPLCAVLLAIVALYHVFRTAGDPPSETAQR